MAKIVVMTDAGQEMGTYEIFPREGWGEQLQGHLPEMIHTIQTALDVDTWVGPRKVRR